MKIRKFSRIVLSLTAALLVMVFAGTALAAGYVQAAGGDVYLRSAPNRSGDDIDAMKEGETATYLDCSAVDERGVVWYYVRYDGKTGWVSSRYSKLYGASVSAPSTGVTSGSVRATGDVYLRTEPNLNGGKITAMKEGQSASYLGSSSVDGRGVTWYYVQFNGRTGWVSSRYAKLSGNYSTVKGVNGDSNIRNMPSLSGNEIGLLKKGQSATYLGDSSVDNRGVVWYKISFNGKTGWVSSRYTKVY